MAPHIVSLACVFISVAAAGSEAMLKQRHSKNLRFHRGRTQFIAANIDPVTGAGMHQASGTGAKNWGIWHSDPGPRGVSLEDYSELTTTNGGTAPAGWHFSKQDWWVEEHGLIMPPPLFPLPAGEYLVTGDRAITTVLTISDNGHWQLADGAKLYDVTHLPCRSARYTPISSSASPSSADFSDWPVQPGGSMPKVNGFKKQDYAVIFVLGMRSSSP